MSVAAVNACFGAAAPKNPFDYMAVRKEMHYFCFHYQLSGGEQAWSKSKVTDFLHLSN